MINPTNSNSLMTSGILADHKLQSSKPKTAEKAIAAKDLDRVEISKDNPPKTIYAPSDSNKLANEKITALKRTTAEIGQKLRDYVEKLIYQQGNSPITPIIQDQSFPRISGKEVQKTSLPEFADNELGVQAVSERIFNFAIAIYGEDKGKIVHIKTAIEQGFREAEKAFGKELPDICKQTYKQIMEQLDKWAEDK